MEESTIRNGGNGCMFQKTELLKIKNMARFECLSGSVACGLVTRPTFATLLQAFSADNKVDTSQQQYVSQTSMSC
jgi:hypothetical protein